jgi:hypothetical protein
MKRERLEASPSKRTNFWEICAIATCFPVESGKYNPSLDFLLRVAQALGLELSFDVSDVSGASGESGAHDGSNAFDIPDAHDLPGALSGSGAHDGSDARTRASCNGSNAASSRRTARSWKRYSIL